MKNGKKPTKRQMELMEHYRLNPRNWLVVKDCAECFEIVSRITGKLRRLNREV